MTLTESLNSWSTLAGEWLDRKVLPRHSLIVSCLNLEGAQCSIGLLMSKVFPPERWVE